MDLPPCLGCGEVDRELGLRGKLEPQASMEIDKKRGETLTQ